jgi:hypothetical protein
VAPSSPRARAGERLGRLLARNRELGAAQRADEAFTTRLRRLQHWQSLRLQETHADLAADPRYGPGVRFFVEDLYAPKDFADRDADVERAFPYMVRTLPRGALDTAGDAMGLYVLTRELDAGMVEALWDTLGADALDGAAYAEGYRICEARDARAEQIDLIRDLAGRLDGLVRSPIVLGALRVARRPAQLAGLGALQDFLERGVSAFHHMGGSQEFVATITRREHTILERIFTGHPAPFADPDA